MDIFDYAMKMEEDGRTYYTEQAGKTSITALKRILTELAADELRHYNIFKTMRDQKEARYSDSEKTKIVDTTKNVFEKMRERDEKLSLPNDAVKVWKKALDVEKESESFYREKADEVDDANYKKILHKIADEEHNHWLIIESVIQFLGRPKAWLEDAEWNNLETY